MNEPFRIDIAETILTDLRDRLARTRWPSASPLSSQDPWAQGTELNYLQSLCDYWREGFDWRTQEAQLNRFGQEMVEVEGQRVHLIHERSPHAHALPVLLVHGWPGSVYEFYKLIPRLTRPEEYGGDVRDAFHVIAPSLPGYGWSAPFAVPGGTPRRFAQLFAALMASLGYARFGLQGGDWGAVITSWLALDAPERVTGLHLNMAGLRPYSGPGSPPMTEEEQSFIKRTRKFWDERFGYYTIQASRPQSLGYGLTDSPAGLAGWIIEKFRDWSDCHGDVESAFTRDELLANLTIYWATSSIASSTRLYYEHRHARDSLGPGQRIEVPTAFADFPGEIVRQPRSWIERAYRLEQYNTMPRGGHFAALEQPELLSEDMRAFFLTRRN